MTNKKNLTLIYIVIFLYTIVIVYKYITTYNIFVSLQCEMNI